ncbi:hypothetical protein Leryth_027519 [Lithospermum erythrorhizon]|nr:hypothetical protein Leryth_027519 [Lithospermum erythrorhizon]
MKVSVSKAVVQVNILDQSSSSVLAISYSPRFKKRKNQQKRVITQVKAEEYLSSDMWAWRKYGQKPIKGSPYPRSYYRCSSMKGCQARKQVEQSCTDPEVYIVTYTAEHCHSQPTRRNSLAGTVRNKFPVIPKSPTAAVGNNSPPVASNKELSSKSPPLNESYEEELSKTNIKQQILDEELRTVEWGHSNNNGDPFFIPEFVMNDDFFSGLGDLDGPEL